EAPRRLKCRGEVAPIPVHDRWLDLRESTRTTSELRRRASAESRATPSSRWRGLAAQPSGRCSPRRNTERSSSFPTGTRRRVSPRRRQHHLAEFRGPVAHKGPRCSEGGSEGGSLPSASRLNRSSRARTPRRRSKFGQLSIRSKRTPTVHPSSDTGRPRQKLHPT